jgi:NAD(P)H-hydrate epimerase
MGAGLVTVATPSSCLPIVATLSAEIMTEPLPETESGSISTRAFDYGRLSQLLEGKSVLAVGPGLGTHAETIEFVRRLIEQESLPLVLDADALNALAGKLDCLKPYRSERLVITPHPGEMSRLLGISSSEVQRQRVELVQRVARQSGKFVILKGFRTLVAAPNGQVYVNPTGNPGMATGGVGDVLTGMVAGAMAQFPAAPMEQVLSLAVYLHGRAGDLAREECAEQGLIASDVTEALPRAWRWLGERMERDQPDSYYLLP